MFFPALYMGSFTNREITFTMNSLVFAALVIILQVEGLCSYLANNTIGNISLHSSLYTGSPVKLIDAGFIEVDLGARLSLNCSSSSFYAT